MEGIIFALSISFGAFFFIIIMICCIRPWDCFEVEDRKHLCFRRKQAEARRRRRVPLPLFSEGIFPRPENTGYTAAPDEALTEISLCQPYVYEDGCTTGMRMIAELPIAIAYTSQTTNSRPHNSLFTPYCPPSPVFHPDHILLEEFGVLHDEPPPPDYNQAQRLVEAESQEPPPPSYSECMSMQLQNIQLHM